MACLGYVLLDEVSQNGIHVSNVEEVLSSKIKLLLIMLLQSELTRMNYGSFQLVKKILQHNPQYLDTSKFWSIVQLWQGNLVEKHRASCRRFPALYEVQLGPLTGKNHH